MTPWVECPTLDIDLSLRPEARYACVPQSALQLARELLQGIHSEFTSGAAELAGLVSQNTGGRFDDEILAVAGYTAFEFESVAVANAAYDFALASLGCSTMALATPEGPVLARNMDWWPEALLARSTHLVRYHDHGRVRFASCGWPGAVGVVTGYSARGFAVALNAVTGSEPADPSGYPVLLLLRRALEDCSGFNDALQLLAETRIPVGALFTLVGTENRQRVVIERSPTRQALRWATGDEALLATNDYRMLSEQPSTSTREVPAAAEELADTACKRFDTLQGLCQDVSPGSAVTDEHLLYFLSDPAVLQEITAQHVIARPRAGKVRAFVPRRLLEPTTAGRS